MIGNPHELSFNVTRAFKAEKRGYFLLGREHKLLNISCAWNCMHTSNDDWELHSEVEQHTALQCDPALLFSFDCEGT